MILHSRNIPTLASGLIMVGMFVLGAVRYDHFADASNIANLMTDYGYVLVAAAGATIVILLGGIDLSAGSVAAFSGVLMAELVGRGWHPLGAGVVCVLAGATAGAIMGFLIQAFELPAFMVTLAGMFAVRAVAFMVLPRSGGIAHPFISGDSTLRIGRADIGWPIIISFIVLGAVWILLRLTPFGRRVYAIGGTERSARMMGLAIESTRIAAYAIAGACSALAGCMLALSRRAGDPSSAIGLELTVIAAVVIGGTLLSGGVGSVLGTAAGVIMIGLMRMMIDFEGALNPAWTSIVTGILLLGFVLLQKLTSFLSLAARARYRGGAKPARSP